MTTRRTFNTDELMPLWMKYVTELKTYAKAADPKVVMPLNEVFQYNNLDGYTRDPQYECFIIEESSHPIGFLFIGSDNQTNSATDYHIAELYVERQYRRNGVARSAIKEFFEKHPGRYCYFVINGNEPALSFWQHIVDSFSAVRLAALPDEGTPGFCTQYGIAISINDKKE